MLAVEVRDLRKRYVARARKGLFRWESSVVEALKGVTFEVKRGEVFGILGPNGAGKSTLVKILATLLLPDGGEARILGFDIVSEREEVRRRIGVSLSVEKGFFYKLTARENLKYFGMLYGLNGSRLNARVEEVLREVGLLKHGDKMYEEMSLGMKARLSIARALLNDPEVLILDEPTLGLDPVSARRVRGLLLDLAHKHGKTILVTTHNMFEAEILLDRVAILVDGRIIAVDSIESLKRSIADSVFIEVRVSGLPHEAAQKILQSIDGARLSTYHQHGSIEKFTLAVPASKAEEALESIVHNFRSSGFKVRGVSIKEPTLEDVFIALTTKRGG